MIRLRELHNIYCIVHDRPSKVWHGHMQALMQIIQAAAEKGWCEYRILLAFQDQVAETFSFSNGAVGRLSKTLKDALDLSGIL